MLCSHRKQTSHSCLTTCKTDAVFLQETDKSSGQPASDSEADYKTTQEERNTEPEPKKKAPAARRPAAAKGNGGTKAAIGKVK